MCAKSHHDRNRVSTSRREFVGAAAVLGTVGLGAGSAIASGDHEGGTGNGDESDPFAAVEFSNQGSDGTEIVVDAVVLSDGGYVAIHDATLFEGQVAESVTGVSEYLEPGAHYAVPVTLFDVPGGSFERSTLDGTTPLVPMPHVETSGNETYDFVASGGEEDGPYVEAGLPVVDGGFVTVDGDEASQAGGPFATVDFRNQPVQDGTVTVRDVTLSEGGFVTLHDARLLQGQALESVVGVSEYLTPGQHQAVVVPLDDPSAVTEVELPARPLLPMPHLDTNGNEAYDFVETGGAEDGPYTKARQAVVDAGLVTIE